MKLIGQVKRHLLTLLLTQQPFGADDPCIVAFPVTGRTVFPSTKPSVCLPAVTHARHFLGVLAARRRGSTGSAWKNVNQKARYKHDTPLAHRRDNHHPLILVKGLGPFFGRGVCVLSMFSNLSPRKQSRVWNISLCFQKTPNKTKKCH